MQDLYLKKQLIQNYNTILKSFTFNLFNLSNLSCWQFRKSGVWCVSNPKWLKSHDLHIAD